MSGGFMGMGIISVFSSFFKKAGSGIVIMSLNKIIKTAIENKFVGGKNDLRTEDRIKLLEEHEIQQSEIVKNITEELKEITELLQRLEGKIKIIFIFLLVAIVVAVIAMIIF